MLFVVAALILWVFRPRTAKHQTPVNKEQAAQQRYNAEQWVERNLQAQQRKQYGVKKTYVKAGTSSSIGRQIPSQPALKPASTPMPTLAPAPSQSDGFSWPFPTSFSSSSHYDDEDKKPKFSSGMGGDFGGGGASGSWDNSSSSSESGSSSSND